MYIAIYYTSGGDVSKTAYDLDKPKKSYNCNVI